MSSSGAIAPAVPPFPPYDHHSQLNNFTANDDHTQYALLAGRAANQILIGGTAASGTLTLQSTSNATRGKVIFGTAGTTAYDEVNDRFGIGTNAPNGSLAINPATPATVATTPGTAGASGFRINATAEGGATSITTTGVGGLGHNVAFRSQQGGTALAAAVSSTGGAGGDVNVFSGGGGVGGATGGSSSVAKGGAGGFLNQTAGNGGAVAGANTSTAANTIGGGGGQLLYIGGNGGAESNGTAGGFGGLGGAVQFVGGTGGASTTGTGGGTHTGGNGGRIVFTAGPAGVGSSANGAPGTILFQAPVSTGAAVTVLTVGNPTFTFADAINLAFGTTTGTKFGTGTAQKIGFYNATPVVQATGTVAVATTAATNASPFGYTTQAQADAIVTLVNALRTVLVNLGLTT